MLRLECLTEPNDRSQGVFEEDDWGRWWILRTGSGSGAVMACTDPVALDYHATKYVLFSNSRLAIHNPDDPNNSVSQYLTRCAEAGGGMLDERHVKVDSYNFKTRALQKDDELVVLGEKTWGTNPKALLKYLVLRYGWV